MSAAPYRAMALCITSKHDGLPQRFSLLRHVLEKRHMSAPGDTEGMVLHGIEDVRQAFCVLGTVKGRYVFY